MEYIFLEISTLLAIKFPTKLYVFQPSRSKLFETLDFLQPKVNFSGEGKIKSKHINMNYV